MFRKNRRLGKESAASSNSSIFISYARADQAIAEDLYDKLTCSGFKPWIDVRNIYPGEDWAGAISSAIEQSDFFVLCLSDNSVGRRGVLQREIKTALDRLLDLLEDDIFLVPVRLSECTRPKQIAKHQTVDLFEPGGYERLLRTFNEGVERRKAFGR
jgi:hypothetical protein